MESTVTKLSEAELAFRTKLFNEVKEHIRCSLCKLLPRPGKKVYKCACGKTYCNNCNVCCDGRHCDNTIEFVSTYYILERPRTNYMTNDYKRFDRTENGSKICENFVLYPEPEPDPLYNHLLSTQLPFECKNTKFGCEQILMPDELMEHEKTCQYYEINCVATSCKESVGFLPYLDHFLEHHTSQDKVKVHRKDGCRNTFIVEEPLRDHYLPYSAVRHFEPSRMTAFDRDFFEVSMVKNQQMYRWIYAHVAPEEAKHFQFRTTLKSECDDSEINVSGPVHPISKDRDDIISSERGVFSISLKTASNMASTDSISAYETLTFTITLRNLKEESKDADAESGISDNE